MTHLGHGHSTTAGLRLRLRAFRLGARSRVGRGRGTLSRTSRGRLASRSRLAGRRRASDRERDRVARANRRVRGGGNTCGSFRGQERASVGGGLALQLVLNESKGGNAAGGLSPTMVRLGVVERDKVNRGTVVAPRADSAKHVVVGRHFVGNRVVNVKRNARNLLLRCTLNVLARDIAESRRRDKTVTVTVALSEQVGEHVTLHELGRKNIHVGKLLQHIGDRVGASILKRILTVLRKDVVSRLLEVGVRIHETSDRRHSIAGGGRGVRMEDKGGDVRNRTTKRPCSHVKLRSVRVLKSSGPTDCLTTTRVTETGHRAVLAQRQLVKSKGCTDRVKRHVTTRAARREGVEGTLGVGNRDDVTSLKIREKLTFIAEVGTVRRTRDKTVARGSLSSVGVLCFSGHNELVLLGIVGHKHGRNRVLRVVRRVLARTVKKLVSLLQVETSSVVLDVHRAPGNDITGLGGLPVSLRSVERVLVGSRKGGSRSYSGTPEGTKARQRKRDHGSDLRVSRASTPNTYTSLTGHFSALKCQN